MPARHLVSSVVASLAALGRHARWALPAGVFAGLVFPAAAACMRPLLPLAVIGTLAVVLVRLDWRRFGKALTRPMPVVALLAWQLLASPLLVWGLAQAIGLAPELRVALLLQAAAPPIGSTAVFALILGLDGALAVVGTVATTLLLPLTATPLVGWLLPEAGVRIDLLAFFGRVSLLVALPFAIAWLVRRLMGAARLARGDDVLGGLNVVMLVVFAIAVMDGVSARLLAEPRAILELLLMSVVVAVVLHAGGYLLLRRVGHDAAWTAALVSGNRNMGLMLVITAGTAGELFALYVGVAQIPMYFAPLLLTPLVRRGSRLRTDPPTQGCKP